MSSPSEVKRAPDSAIPDRARSPAAHPQEASEQGANLTAFSRAARVSGPRAAALPHDLDSAAFTADCDLSSAPAAFGPGPDAATRRLGTAPVDHGSWLPPEEFDEYRLVRLLGRGAMGQVYLAHDRVLDRAVAVKFITALQADARERFLIEARAAARIQHPNVIAIYRVGELENRPYLISEYVRGQNLSDLRLPLTGHVALELGIGLARGLAAAHRMGVLHRDIKLANAILGERGDIKLLDFGLAKLVDGAPTLEQPGSDSAIRAPSTTLTAADLHTTGIIAEDDSLEVSLDARSLAELSRDSLSPAQTQPTQTQPTHNQLTHDGAHADVSRADPLREQASSIALMRDFDNGWAGPGADLTEAGALIGTPHYMAPELWRAEPASRRSDVYALGVLLHILCCGHPPTEARDALHLAQRVQIREPRALLERVPDLDPRLAAIIDRCLRRSPTERFASGEQLRLALEALSSLGRDGLAPTANPYRGLRPFDAEHREVFFGRNLEVQNVVDLLRSQPFVLVAGDSGVGKSSLCCAGVLPIVGEGVLEPARTWVITQVTPGRRPVQALISALARGLDLGEDALLTSIRTEPDALERALRRQQGDFRGRIIFVDQLEELVTLATAEDAALAARIIGQLAAGIPGVRVLATVRGDFLTRIAQLPGLGLELPRALYFLLPLGRENIHKAVVGPAEVKGVRFESEAIVEQLVQAGLDGSLPLLQFALAEIWEARDQARGTITAEDLDKLGGVSGALARHADGVLARLSPAQRRAAHTLLLHLVTLESTRATLGHEELVGDDLAARTALEALLAGRLLVVREQSDGFVYEIAHEALIQRWTTLQVWLEEEAESRIASHRLAAAAADWDRLGRPHEDLWGARQLAELRRHGALSLRPREAAFLAASEARARRRRRIRGAMVLAIPALLLLTILGAALARRAVLERQVDQHLARAVTLVQDAREHDAELLRLRAAAFANFHARDPEAGEETWALALDAAPAALALYNQAARELETALNLGSDRADLRRSLAEVLHERAAIAEREHDPALAEELLARANLYDVAGEQAARWRAPARLDLQTSPPGARVTLASYIRDQKDYLRLGPARELGDTPWEDVSIPAGSHLLVLEAAGHATVRYPLLLARGEALALNITLPPAAEIPKDFIYIPAGRFLFGSPGDEDLRRRFLTAVPLHEVHTDAYLIARYETTYAEWITFLESLPMPQRSVHMRTGDSAPFRHAPTLALLGGKWHITVPLGDVSAAASAGELLHYPTRTRRIDQDWLRFPVSGLNLADAGAYLAWLDSSGRVPGARLCSELEWERAARGADGRKYPTGGDISTDDANYDETYDRKPASMGADEVGSHPASESPFGVQDTMGNVWEWVTPSTSTGKSIVRGGAFWFSKITSSPANRSEVDPGFREGTLGLRVCATPRF